MMEEETTFRERVEMTVSQIPIGRLMTYGQIAAICGNARAARIVGGIAHFGDAHLPWQRVVSKQGMMASGFPGGRQAHRELLENEGIIVGDDFKVDIKELIWYPNTPGR